MKPELVAPAGSMESLFAAFQYGADSVYLGLGTLNARASAKNFDIEQLELCLNYAHNHGKKIYTALNVLVKNSELDEIFSTLTTLTKLRTDGIIIQDLGIYEIIKKYFPSLPIHFSTQMTIHNTEGVKIAEKMGAGRVILARELTLKEIEHIRKNTKLELEVFIQGARCYSYSGLCLFSSMMGGRSGNRGTCAQPCRKLYSMDNKKEGYFFSMCDLCAIRDIPTLVGMGINAFKIEGRLKNPLYVAYVSSLYRKAIDGTKIDIKQAENELKTIFSRETKSIPKENEIRTNPDFPGHLGLYAGTVIECKGNYATFITEIPLEKYDGLKIIDPQKKELIGIPIREMTIKAKNVFSAPENTKITIKIPQPISKNSKLGTLYTNHNPNSNIGISKFLYYKIFLCSKRSLQDTYRIRIPKLEKSRIPITLDIKIEDNKFKISCLNNKKEYSVTISKAKDKGLDEKLLIKYFSRLGDTPYELKNINLSAPLGIFIPPKELNQIRRDFFQGLLDTAPYDNNTIITPPRWPHGLRGGGEAGIDNAPASPIFTVKIDNSTYIDYIKDVADQIILEINPSFIVPQAINNKIIIFSLPPIIKQKDIIFYKKQIDDLLGKDYKHFQISNLGHLELFKDKDVILSADYPLYIFNSLSLITLQNLGIKRGTLSPELNIEELKEMIPVVKNNADIILYSNLPYFYSDNTVLVGENTIIENKEKDKFLVINKNNSTIVLNQRPFSLLSQLDNFIKLGHRMFRIDFLYKKYTPEEIETQLNLLRNFLE